jgi:ABC-type polysaccharide/polyol phosphate transport system ATPase subunit
VRLPREPGADTAINLDSVGKRYWKLEEQAMLLRSLLPFARPKRSEIWALRGVSMNVRRGETVGMLGRNGAGKTSLLRLLAGVSSPSEGRVQVMGRIAPLISVGVGFQKEMSGRENVYLNGMLLGLTRREIDERFASIVDFAEIPEFIDTPVKFYSSGMFMRLGFSVAIHVEPDVLLVDEVLAVGDIAFQFKCFERMRKIQEGGTTIVIVSHSMHAIRLLCPRTVVMRRGRMEFDGDTESAIALHHELLSHDRDADTDDPDAVGGVEVVHRELRGPDGMATNLEAHVPHTFKVRIRFERSIDSPRVEFDILAEDGTLAYHHHAEYGQTYRHFQAGDEAEVDIAFTPRLAGGTYRLLIAVTSTDGRRVLYRDSTGMYVYTPPPLGSGGIADCAAEITIDGTYMSDHRPIMLADGTDPAAVASSQDEL